MSSIGLTIGNAKPITRNSIFHEQSSDVGINVLKKKSKKPEDDPRIATLLAHSSVTRLRLPSGQVLIYAGHTPGGLYVLLSGWVYLTKSLSEKLHPAARIIKAGKSAVLYPSLTDLDRPAECHSVIGAAVDIMFVPRMLIQSQVEIRQLLESL